MKVAAIDCGTNSVRLLIGERCPDGGMAQLRRELRITRLGQDVDATGSFHPDALRRTLDVVAEYADMIGEADVDAVRMVATSAARDAGNRQAFVDGVRAALGVLPEVIEGREEAELSFLGARAGLPNAADPMLVTDIGGGSTELAIGADGELTQGVSLDMGSVRMRERHLCDDPPTAAQIEAARADVDSILDSHPGLALDSVATFVGVAGTVTTMSAIQHGLTDGAEVHRTTLTRAQIADVATELLAISVDELLSRWPQVPRARAEVLCAGALICERVAARVPAEVLTVSTSDILDGIALRMLTGNPA